MEKRWMALVALSAAASVAFVGCSCGSKVENSISDSNQIEVQSDVTISSEITTTTTTEDAAATETSAETATTETTESSETGTTVSRRVQFVGQAGGRATTTAKPVVVTVIVTVTNAPATNPPAQTTTTTIPPTETPAVTTTTLVTINMPDGLFTPEEDLCFTVEENAMTVGGIQPALSTLAEEITAGTPVNGGSAAYVYTCDGYRVNTEVMAMPDGSTQEQITEIVLTGDNVCTNKGVKAGSSIDTIVAAYGNEDCEIVDTYIYRYKTEDGYVMDFTTDGSVVTEIHYYKSVQ